MAGAIELATLKAPVVADVSGFKKSMSVVKKEGEQTSNVIEGLFKNSSKKTADYWDKASSKIQKSLKTTEQEAKELTKVAASVYKDGFGKSANDVVRALNQTKRAMGDVDGKELETATKRALELRDTLGIKMSKTLKMAKQEMSVYGSTAEEAFDRVDKRLEKNKVAWEKLGAVGEKTSKLGTALTIGVTTPMIGLGTAAIKTASDFESANAKIVSALNLTDQQGIVTKNTIKSIYSDGFGESLDDVTESLIEVKQQLKNIPDDQIVKVTENAMILRDTLGQDMGESLRGVNSLMTNFGMTADQAMDLYVKGTQTGLDKTHELGDNLAEYGQLWSQAGFSAKDMFAILDNGLKAGAYNLDKVNDFVKEFSVSLNDGRIEQNLSSFSKGTQNVFKEFKNGKRDSQDVFNSVVNDLKNTTDQQKKLTIASTVWSALGEDNAMKVIESLTNVNGTYDNVAGSMEKVKKQQNETFGSKTKSMWREAQSAMLPLGETLLKMATEYMPTFKKGVDSVSNALNKLSADDINKLLKIGGIVAVAGPTVSALGHVTSGVSKVGGALRLGAGALGIFQKSAATAGGTTGIGMLGPALAAVANPIGLATIAATGLGAALVYFSIKQDEARKKAEKWGTTLSSTADNELTKFKSKVDETSDAMLLYEKGVGTANAVGEAFKNMNNQIAESAKKANDELEKAGKLLGLTQEQIDKGKAATQEKVDNAQSMSDQVVAIYQKHNSDMSQLTEEEKNIVLNNQKEMINTETLLANLSKDDRTAVQKALNGNINELNQTQLEDSAKHFTKLFDAEKEAYEKEKDALETALKSKAITQEEYNAKEKAAQDKHNVTVEAYGEKYKAIMDKINGKMQENGMAATATGIWEETKKTLDEYGSGLYDKVVENSLKAKKSLGEASGMVAQYTAEMTQDGKNATNTWNALVFDPKTGIVKQNAEEEVRKALSAENGWDQMQFVLKNANLETNAKIKIGEALVANDQWKNLNPAEKTLVVNNHKGLQAIFDSKESMSTWNKMPIQVKELLCKNEEFLNEKDVAQSALESWNKLTPAQKMLTAQNMTGQPTSEAQATIDKLLGKEVGLVATNNALTGKNLAQGTVNTFEGKTVQLYSGDSAGDGKGKAQRTVDSLTGKTVKLFADNQTQSGVDAAFTSLGKIPENKSVYLNFVSGALPHANGTASHEGGLALVNDQAGPLYEEMITLKNGVSFIPKGRNVVLPLEKGARVDKAADTERILKGLPRFANGANNDKPLPFVGYNATLKPIAKDTSISVDRNEIYALETVKLLKLIYEKDTDILLDGKSIADYVEKTLTRRSRA